MLKYLGTDDLDSAEGKPLINRIVPDQYSFSGARILPANQPHPVIEKEVPACLPGPYGQGRQGPGGCMVGDQAAKIKVADDVDIAYDERSGAGEVRGGFEHSPSGFQQL